jgi:pyruvate formate lyase activating enzyme
MSPIRPVAPKQLVGAARRCQADLVVSSYNEPLITAEWAVSVFEEARKEGFLCAFVSNGNATPEAIEYLRPWICAYKVDLKSFNDQRYRSLGGTLEQVKSTIAMVHERGIWLEVLTLLVPGFNDDEQELRSLTAYLAGISPDIPWHVTAFHQDYRMRDPRNTAALDLIRACEIGCDQGLRFVYAGNLPGRVGPWENTRCPHCSMTLIERIGYVVQEYRLTPDGRCPACNSLIPGVWAHPDQVKTGHGLADQLDRLPRRVRLDENSGQSP